MLSLFRRVLDRSACHIYLLLTGIPSSSSILHHSIDFPMLIETLEQPSTSCCNHTKNRLITPKGLSAFTTVSTTMMTTTMTTMMTTTMTTIMTTTMTTTALMTAGNHISIASNNQRQIAPIDPQPMTMTNTPITTINPQPIPTINPQPITTINPQPMTTINPPPITTINDPLLRGQPTANSGQKLNTFTGDARSLNAASMTANGTVNSVIPYSLNGPVTNSLTPTTKLVAEITSTTCDFSGSKTPSSVPLNSNMLIMTTRPSSSTATTTTTAMMTAPVVEFEAPRKRELMPPGMSASHILSDANMEVNDVQLIANQDGGANHAISDANHDHQVVHNPRYSLVPTQDPPFTDSSSQPRASVSDQPVISVTTFPGYQPLFVAKQPATNADQNDGSKLDLQCDGKIPVMLWLLLLLLLTLLSLLLLLLL